MSSRVVGAFVVVGSLGLAACGSSDEPAASDLSVESTVGGGAATFGDGDVVFIQGMVPHHEQAVEMADIALDPTVEAGEAVVALAAAVKAAQDPEIEMMTG